MDSIATSHSATANHGLSPQSWQGGRTLAVVLTAAYLLWAALLITNFEPNLPAPQLLDQVFNDVARRMLSWDFTVSPSAIQYEAFEWRGATYTYYGIFPALLRMPLVLAGFLDLHISTISCLAALAIAVYCYLRLYQTALPMKSGHDRPWFLRAVLLSAVVTGPPIYLLASASLYHELIFWSAALTAVFSYVVLRAWFRGRDLTSTELMALAVLAGLCLLCRVPEGIGLYAALLLLLLHAFVHHAAELPRGQRMRQLLLVPRPTLVLLAVGCLSLVFVAALGVVNYGRWGDPLKTSPYAYYIQFRGHQDWLDIYARHGLFSWLRVVVAAWYYLAAAKLEVVAPTIVAEYYGYIEGPRSFTIICVPLTVMLAIIGLFTALRRPGVHQYPLILLAGELAGILVILGFPALTMRYTFSFWAPLVSLAAIGGHALCQTSRAPRLVSIAACLLLLVGVAGSHATLLRYKIVSVATPAPVRYELSRALQPLVCPRASLNPDVKLTDLHPLVTPNCPPLW